MKKPEECHYERPKAERSDILLKPAVLIRAALEAIPTDTVKAAQLLHEALDYISQQAAK